MATKTKLYIVEAKDRSGFPLAPAKDLTAHAAAKAATGIAKRGGVAYVRVGYGQAQVMNCAPRGARNYEGFDKIRCYIESKQFARELKSKAGKKRKVKAASLGRARNTKKRRK